ncbi:endonuclease/exonuclease/phosphatase family protein [Alteromonas sp. SM 2104]|nr:endonuclease/exonuclease/phosphatase family protein [Alteromonas oceanisediminis]
MPRWVVFLPLLLIRWTRFTVKRFLVIITITLLNVGWVADLELNPWRPDEIEADFSLITFNMGTDIAQAKQVALVFLSQAPDVMLVQESEENALRSVMPDDVQLHCHKALCLLTRHKFTFQNAITRRDTGSWGTFGARYSINLAQCVVNIVNVHPDTPRFTLLALLKNPLGGYAEAQALYAKRELDHMRLQAWLNGEAIDVIAGDFNSTAVGPMLSRYWNTYDNAFDQVGTGFGTTYREKGFATRIDHVLFNPKLTALDARVLDDTGTTHRPLAADFSLPRECAP